MLSSANLVAVGILLLPVALASNIQAVACLRAHHVPFQTRTESSGIVGTGNWTDLITPYNLRISWQPSIVTLPQTPEHVSRSVTCAAAAGIKVGFPTEFQLVHTFYPGNSMVCMQDNTKHKTGSSQVWRSLLRELLQWWTRWEPHRQFAAFQRELS